MIFGFSADGPTVSCIYMAENANPREIVINFGMVKNELSQWLGGLGTFLGKWCLDDEDDIIIVLRRGAEEECNQNKNKLPRPFHKEKVYGPIVLVRIGADCNPEPLTLNEYYAHFKSV